MDVRQKTGIDTELARDLFEADNHTEKAIKEIRPQNKKPLPQFLKQEKKLQYRIKIGRDRKPKVRVKTAMSQPKLSIQKLPERTMQAIESINDLIKPLADA